MGKNLALYFTLGYPDQATLERFMNAIPPGCVDYVEFGFPSSSPIYDGPRIRETHRLALKNYDRHSSEGIFEGLLKGGIGLYSLTYYRDIASDPESFYRYLRQHGFSGVIVPDLLVDYAESAGNIIGALQSAGLELIPFFNPSTPDSLLQRIAGLTSSWIYYGLQPSTGINVPFDVRDVTERAMELLPGREINFGFGIRESAQVKELVDCGASGVIVGTALINMLDSRDEKAFSAYIGKLRGVLNGN